MPARTFASSVASVRSSSPGTPGTGAVRASSLRRLATGKEAAGVTALGLAIWMAVMPGCSSSDSTGGTGGGGSSTAPTGPYARFTLPAAAMPNFLDVPFPSDAYLTSAHLVSETIPGIENVVKKNQNFLTHELAKQNGFSRIAPVLFWIDDAAGDASAGAVAAVDPTSLPTSEAASVADTSSVYLIDLAATDPTKARIPCRAKYHDDSPTANVTRPGLAVGPARGYVLQEGHSYAAVLTSRVKDKSGAGLGASTDFQDVVAGRRTDANGKLYADAVTKVQTALASALAADKATVVAVAPFTTNSETSQLYTLRDSLEGATAPTLSWDAALVLPMTAAKFAAGATAPTGFTATLDAWLGTTTKKLADGSDDPDESLTQVAHDKIAALGTGVFTANNYLQVKDGGYNTVDHATFTYDASGNIVAPTANPTAKIWATFTIPTGTMPAAGWPVVILQHGLNQSRTFILSLANTFAAKGWVTVAIDSVTFGARAPEAMYQIDKGTNVPSTITTATYKGPDGFADNVGANAISAGSTNGSTDFFGGLLNIGAIRDQFRQSMIDTVQVVKMLRNNPDLRPLATGTVPPKLDATNIAYLGNSLGGIEGAGAAALEPSLKAWTLNVAGGGVFTELAAHGPTIGSELSQAGSFNFGFGNDNYDEAHPFVILCQNLLEPGDPISFAGNIVTAPHTLKGAATQPRNVLQVEVVYDELVSNESNEALARAMGIGLATPNVGSNAGVIDIADLSKSISPVKLPDVNPGSDGSIHDTPMAGTTAVLVQQSPGEHGSNLVESVGQRSWRIPYYTPAGTVSAIPTGTPQNVPCSYQEIQTTVTGFFASAFAGKVPTVAGFKTPVRDADGDGVLDATDPNPVNASQK